MAWIRTVSEDEATGSLKRRYEADENKLGFVMEATKVWSVRPEVGDAYENLQAAVKRGSGLTQRESRLINLLIADRIHSTYCVLVYASHLEREFGGSEGIRVILRDHHRAQLSDREVAILDYALEAAVGHPTEEHFTRLRAVGLRDEDILDIAVVANLRLLGSRVYDALGVETDPFFLEQSDLVAAVTTGR